MLYILIITGLVLVLLGAALTIAYLLRQQRDAAMQDVTTIAQRLKDLEMMLERESRASREEDEETPSTPQEDLSAMSNEELFQYLTTFIREHKLYLWSDLNRAAVMQHFSLSAARVGAAFAKGGGQSLPEFVRNCRLEHACHLMVEHPTMSFVEVGYASGFQHTTTFYHDFKARYGMTPAEYRTRGTEEKIQAKMPKDETRVRPS